MSSPHSLSWTVIDQPGPQTRDAIAHWVRESSLAQVGPSGMAQFAITCVDDDGQLLGGAWVQVFFGWLYLELLSVAPQARGRNLGSRLLQAVEAQARERGCNGVWLNCFSFHAPPFYLNNGYEVFARLDDFPPGHTNYFFRKQWPLS